VACPAGTAGDFSYNLATTDYQVATISPGVATRLGLGQSTGSQLSLPAPPQGFIFRYQLLKEFQVVRGEAVAISSTGAEANLQFTFVATCQITSQARIQLDCQTGQEIEPTPPPLAAATPTPLPSPTATLEPIPSPTWSPQPEPTTSPTLPPAPTPAPPPAVSKSCPILPGPGFAALWQAYRPLLGCPLSEAVTIPVLAEEIFEGGHLFWRSDTDEIYIVYDRRKKGQELIEGRWELNPSWRKWDGSNPDGIGLAPPPGLVEPKRGFGWLWRSHLAGEDGPLGWALDQEYGFEQVGQVQRFEQGLMFKGSSAKIYLLGDNGRFITP
jgi:hypothetical protein